MTKVVYKVFVLVVTLFRYQLFAQHEAHLPKDSTVAHRTEEKYEQHLSTDDAILGQGSMSSKYSLTLPMSRNGSGTSWLPDETPIYAYMMHQKKSMMMFHGNCWLRYNNQHVSKQNERGGAKFDAPNWIMGMFQQQVGSNGLLIVSTMFSLDALTVGGNGYPLLFQTGESYKGQKLVDRQHPHDLFAELSLGYTQRFSSSTDVSFVIGYPAEPALGPPAFMHRISAINNPNAPLAHHHQDATHITFGNTTLGLRYKNFKVEGSLFNGREPDEHRYNFDKLRLNSYALRLSYNPTRESALQISKAFIKAPEALSPGKDIERVTASAIHTQKVSETSYIATTLVFGQNDLRNKNRKLSSVLLENNAQLGKIAIYGRYEFVQKDAHELGLDETHTADNRSSINAMTFGLSYILSERYQTSLVAGAQITINYASMNLHPIYGKMPSAIQVYLRISPKLLRLRGSHNHTLNSLSLFPFTKNPGQA